MAKQKGTELHDFAARCIKLGQKLPKSKKTLNAYVNDAIGFKMTPEQLQAWIAIRKKCATFKSKKDYTRKEKHRNAKYDD